MKKSSSFKEIITGNRSPVEIPVNKNVSFDLSPNESESIRILDSAAIRRILTKSNRPRSHSSEIGKRVTSPIRRGARSSGRSESGRLSLYKSEAEDQRDPVVEKIRKTLNMQQSLEDLFITEDSSDVATISTATDPSLYRQPERGRIRISDTTLY